MEEYSKASLRTGTATRLPAGENTLGDRRFTDAPQNSMHAILKSDAFVNYGTAEQAFDRHFISYCIAEKISRRDRRGRRE